ncbi:MAG: TolC family protein [Thiotrichales bacterium]|nr:TolC family protein [Thiotrichales bacterium]
MLQDPEVDIIIANGLLASHVASQLENLAKPVIAPVVADRVLQDLPYQEGHSGKKNYVYISDNRTVEEDLRKFHALTGFRHLAIVVDRLFLDALPQLKGTTYEVQKELGFDIDLLPVTFNPADALEGMKGSVDAVYVPPLLRFNTDAMHELAEELISRKLPGFSLLGRDELELGLMATLNGRDIDTLRYARRIALYIQSILLGEPASGLKVHLDQTSKLAINMRTARAINFSPKWRFIEEAELLYEKEEIDKTPISLVQAMQQAVAANLALRVNEVERSLATDNVDRARSDLLPQIELGASVNQIDSDRAGLTVPQNSVDGDLNISQVIYSERLWSQLDINELLKTAQDQEYRSNVLDVLQSSATAYLQLLQARAREQVRRSNLIVTETNLELAETRQRIGYSDRSEVLRWRSQLATDRRNVYSAGSDREQAETELKRLLNLPLLDPIAVTDEGIGELLTILASKRFQRFFDNPLSFSIFTEFEVERAIDNSPELSQIDNVIASNQRQLQAAKRAYYVPDIALNGNYGRNVSRGGTGADNQNLFDDEWSVGIQATIPLFAGGARRAEVSRANNTLVQSRYRQHDARERVEARVRAALQRANGTYPAIRLTRNASEAAQENLQLIIDAYSKGVVSVTDLIDAQDAALSADLSAVEAQYSFMIDWMEIQRAVASYDLLLDPDGFEDWYQSLDNYYKQTIQ